MKTLLVVVDGLGLREETDGNAFKQAETPNIDNLIAEYDYNELEASETAVGLPKGYTGNSEVGHLHLGAGRRIPQRLTRINDSIKKGELKEKKSLKQAFQRAEEKNATVHLAGILSDGGIHGHIDHLKSLINISENYDVDIEIHAFTDGRDVGPKSAENYIRDLKNHLEDAKGDIATVMGRFYAMDRDSNWDRTRQAYEAMAGATGFKFETPEEAVEKAYGDGEYDYFIQPSARHDYEGMEFDDELIFYNYRADRERQIVEPFVNPEFNKFENNARPCLTSMFSYRRDFDNPVIFEKMEVENTLGEKIEKAGLSQLRVAESQKKPHVTYFFNGQRELEFEHEERKFIESDKIRAFDERPEMHAKEITDIVINSIEKGKKDFILMNYANCDLVGHTGDLEATVTAVETVDKQIGRLIDAVNLSDYKMIITSDHGNCEDMGAENSANTSHTLNKVPFITIGFESYEITELSEVSKVIGDMI